MVGICPVLKGVDVLNVCIQISFLKVILSAQSIPVTTSLSLAKSIQSKGNSSPGDRLHFLQWISTIHQEYIECTHLVISRRSWYLYLAFILFWFSDIHLWWSSWHLQHQTLSCEDSGYSISIQSFLVYSISFIWRRRNFWEDPLDFSHEFWWKFCESSNVSIERSWCNIFHSTTSRRIVAFDGFVSF